MYYMKVVQYIEHYYHSNYTTYTAIYTQDYYICRLYSHMWTKCFTIMKYIVFGTCSIHIVVKYIHTRTICINMHVWIKTKHIHILYTFIYIFITGQRQRDIFLLHLEIAAVWKTSQHLTKRGPSPWGRGSRASLSVQLSGDKRYIYPVGISSSLQGHIRFRLPQRYQFVRQDDRDHIQ